MTDSVPKEYYTLRHASTVGVFAITDVHRNALRALALSKNNFVVDFGCGNGELLSLIVRSGAKATGIDYVKASVALAKERVPQAIVVEGDIASLPFPNLLFDRAVSLGTIGYLSRTDLQKHFKEASRVLLPKALYVIRVTTPQNYIGVCILKLLHPRYTSSTHFYSKSLYVGIATVAGFQTVRSWRSYDSAKPKSFIRNILRYILFPFLAPLWITFEK